MHYFYHLQKQSFFRWHIALLCAVVLVAQVLEAEHAAAPDCDEHFCVLCHGNGDDEHLDVRLASNYSSDFKAQTPALVVLELDNSPAGNLPIRAPPQFSL